MELEIEIPIWYKGKVKWISNLTKRSTCFDIIQAILLSLSIDSHSNDINHNFVIYECWRGIERPLKNRCRLLKLWNSWAGECENVILTLRSSDEEIIPTHILIREQEKKLNKLKNQLNKTDKQIKDLNENENEKNILIYLNLSRSIIHLNNEIKNIENVILSLISNIKNENSNDFNQLFININQTLIISRKLTLLSDQFDQQIHQINYEIDQKLILLDELELDFALQENIHLDNLHDQQQLSPIISIKTLTVPTRPTAIVEPNLINQPSNHLIPLNYHCKLINNEESDTGISSNDEQLITLV